MIVVFQSTPVITGTFTTFNVVNSRAATAAAEITNLVEWITTYS